MKGQMETMKGQKETAKGQTETPKGQIGTVKTQVKVLMKYRYNGKWCEKFVTLGDVAGRIGQGKYRQRVDAVRGSVLVPTSMGMSSGRLAAEYLPCVYPALGLVADSDGRMGAQAGYTGLVLLSLRVEQGVEVLERLRQRVNLWPQVLLSFVGTSGQSLKVVIPYRLTGGGVPAAKPQAAVGGGGIPEGKSQGALGGGKAALFAQYAYKRAAEYVLNSTGVRAEEVVHDGSEHFRVSADEQVYYNPEALAIEMEQPTELLTDTTAPVVVQTPEVQLDTQVLPGYTRREMDVTKFNFICRDMAFRAHQEPEVYLMKLATECCRSGIDQELATKLACNIGDFYDKETLVRSTFCNAYAHHRLGLKQPVDKSTMYQQLLEAFLRRRYMFRRNRVTGEVEYQEKFRYELWWKPLTEEAQNDINNAAIGEGIKVWPQDLERILVSERIDTYDPVRQWLMDLPSWDGRDRLGELADRVPTDSPAWRDNFKIWMRSMVSQWRSGTSAMYGAQMVLMLVGGQGTRKSTFMRMLLPPELMPFYIDRIDFANKKEALRALHRFLLINIDEYDQISKSQTAFLKHLIQRTDVKERKLYSTVFEQQQRYAAFCATTNSLMQLKDESGSRRYMVVEVSAVIDTDTTGQRAIDYPQLYAQIVSEIEHGEEYAFTGERERQIVERNADYYETPNVVSLFEDLFRRPLAGDEVVLKSPTEILTYIKDKKKINVVTQANATVIGSYLHRNGFQKGKGRQYRRYEVALAT